MDAPAGLEPTQAESKSAVLPLDEGAVVGDLGIEPSCLSATDLQSAAVANAAHHPKLVDPVGLEPTTYRLKARCSTY